MANAVSFSDVEAWLDALPEMVFRDVEQVPDSNATFNFRVKEASGLVVHVFQPSSKEQVVVAMNLTFDGDELRAVHENRDQFMSKISSVLANSPGVYGYTDENGNQVPDDEFNTVALRHWIYPDGLTEQKLNETVIDMISAAAFVRDAVPHPTDSATVIEEQQ